MSFFLLLAQAAAAGAWPETAAAPQQGVISYPASYFAAQQPASALDMISRIPGFSFDGGSSVRGFEGAAGNVLIDGQRPTSKSDYLGDILTRIPASKVERIDIIRGGAPGIDMQGKTVLANVIRKAGGGVRGLAQIGDFYTNDGRNLFSWRAEASGEVGKRKWELAARRNSGLNDGAAPGIGTQIFADGRAPIYSDLSGKGDGWQHIVTGAGETPLAHGTLRVNGRWLDDHFADENRKVFRVTPARREDSADRQVTHESEFGLNYARPFGAATNLEIVGLRTDRTRNFESVFAADTVSEFNQRNVISETIGRAVLKHRFHGDLSVEAGGETAVNKLDSVSFVTDVVVPGASVRVEEDRSELFAKATWKPSATWTLDGAVRYEFSTISSAGDVVLGKSLAFLKPRASLTWAPSSDRQVRLRVEREVGQLNFGDFVASGSLNSAGGVTAGNPDLNPEQDWVVEAAVEQHFWAGAVAVLTYGHYWVSDAIDRGPVFSPSGVFDHPTNIGDATRDRLRLELTLPFDRFGFKGALLKGDVTKRWTKVTDPTTHTERRISGIDPLDWNASFSYDMPALKITWGADVGGGFHQTYYRFNLIEDFKLRTYMRPYLEWRPKPDRAIRFEIGNVTQRDSRDTYRLYPGPRSAGGKPDIDDRHITKTTQGIVVRLRKNFGT
jgi:outer membrane receptor protein involved in Fe transport